MTGSCSKLMKISCRVRALILLAPAVYTEAPQEFFVEAGFAGPYLRYTDLLTQDERVDHQPLLPLLTHDRAVAGGIIGEAFLLPAVGLGSDAFANIASGDPAERLLARRSLQYAYAHGLAFGQNLFSPELGAKVTVNGWGFEVESLFGTAAALVMDDLTAALEFVPRLMAFRGSEAASDYLQLGRLRRTPQLALTAADGVSAVDAVEVQLLPVTTGQGGAINGVELDDVEPVVCAAWESTDGATRAVAIVNFDQVDLTAELVLDTSAKALGLVAGQTYAVQVLGEQGQPLLSTPQSVVGGQSVAVDVALPAESIRLVTMK